MVFTTDGISPKVIIKTKTMTELNRIKGIVQKIGIFWGLVSSFLIVFASAHLLELYFLKTICFIYGYLIS